MLAETSNSLLEFILGLLRDDDMAAAFAADPQTTLSAAGLEGICAEDVDSVLPLVLDYAPVTVASSFDREYNTGGNNAGSGWAGYNGHDGHDGHTNG
ncbi:MAG: IniB N-terminal domain-containing protein, partial [Ilumatobacteraceae bacterium]